MITKVGKLNRSVSIIGVGSTPFGDVLKTPEMLGMTERELFSWASLEAMKDAGIEAKDIDAFYVGQCMGETLAHQFATYGTMSDWVGMRYKAGFHHESACSSSNTGLKHAVLDVASGVCDVVLSGGVEIINSWPPKGKPAHMREPIPPEQLWFKTGYGADQAYWYFTGFGVSIDEYAGAYARKYGLTLEQMDDVMVQMAINNRRAAVRNPLATFATKEFTEVAKEHGFDDAKTYLKSKYNPKLGMLMRPSFGPITADAATAVIVCPTEMAKKLTDHPIEVIGVGTSVSLSYHGLQTMKKEGIDQAYAMAGIKDPKREIDFMLVQDTLILEALSSAENGGYLPEGEGWRAVLDGRTAFDGDKPLSTGGGRSSLGHSWAAAAGADIAEAVWQMRGQAGPRQIKKIPEVTALVSHGHGGNCNVAVLRTVS